MDRWTQLPCRENLQWELLRHPQDHQINMMQVLPSARNISPRINIREPDILLHKCLHISQSPVVERFTFARSMKRHPLHRYEAVVRTGNTVPLLQLWLASFLFIMQSLSDVWLTALQHNTCPLNHTSLHNWFEDDQSSWDGFFCFNWVRFPLFLPCYWWVNVSYTSRCTGLRRWLLLFVSSAALVTRLEWRSVEIVLWTPMLHVFCQCLGVSTILIHL